MKICFTVLVLFISASYYGQQKTLLKSAPEPTADNLKKLFNARQVPEMNPEWISCTDKDSLYYTSDTVKLYNDQWYYLRKHGCFVISWVFSNSSTFSIVDTKTCIEPPLSMSGLDNSDLKISYDGTAKNGLTILVHKKSKIKDKFIVSSLRQIELNNDWPVYELTLIRAKVEK